MRARNDTAEILLAKLHAIGVNPQCGYFMQKNYCVGVSVRHIEDAFALGAKLGEQFGKVSYDRHFVVFPDAHVTA